MAQETATATSVATSPIEHFTLAVDGKRRPGRARIGVLVPATDHMSEIAFQEMLAGTPVDFFTNRVASKNVVTAANLAGLIDDLERATATLLPTIELDAVAFSCTSGTVICGDDKVIGTIHKVRPGLPVITPITAAIHAFETLGVREIAVLTPYTDEINRAIRAYLDSHGLNVLRFGSFSLDTEQQITSVPTEAIVAAGRELCRSPEVQGLFISCTAMRGHAAVVAIEAATGRPVITSNQAQVWDVLRVLGLPTGSVGFGSIFAGRKAA